MLFDAKYVPIDGKNMLNFLMMCQARDSQSNPWLGLGKAFKLFEQATNMLLLNLIILITLLLSMNLIMTITFLLHNLILHTFHILQTPYNEGWRIPWTQSKCPVIYRWNQHEPKIFWFQPCNQRLQRQSFVSHFETFSKFVWVRSGPECRKQHHSPTQ